MGRLLVRIPVFYFTFSCIPGEPPRFTLTLLIQVAHCLRCVACNTKFPRKTGRPNVINRVLFTDKPKVVNQDKGKRSKF